MDIKEMLDGLVEKIRKDDKLVENFKKDPITTVEKLIGVDLPNDQLEKLVDAIKAKLAVEDVGDALNMLGGLLGRKKK